MVSRLEGIDSVLCREKISTTPLSHPSRSKGSWAGLRTVLEAEFAQSFGPHPDLDIMSETALGLQDACYGDGINDDTT